MRKEHFRGVVWPRQKDGLHRYVIVGMLVTDQPISELEGNEFVLDGAAFGMADLLAMIPQKEPSHRIGDANSVLVSLDHLVKEKP